MALLTALLHACGADLFGAAWGQLRLSDANLARGARIDARLHLRAGLAFQRVVDGVTVAASGTRWIFGTEPHSVVDPGKLAAAEAVTTIRCKRPAIIQAGLGLRHVCLSARSVVAGNVGAWIVCALAAFRRVIRGDFERVAFVAPVAIVISGARVLVEVAIRLAR